MRENASSRSGSIRSQACTRTPAAEHGAQHVVEAALRRRARPSTRRMPVRRAPRSTTLERPGERVRPALPARARSAARAPPSGAPRRPSPPGARLPLHQDRHAVAQHLGLAQVVRREQDRLAVAALQLVGMNARSASAERGIEAARRLVHQQDRRVVQQRARDGEALLHPRRVVGEAPVGRLDHVHPRQQLVDAGRARARRGNVVQLGEEPQVLARPTGASRTSARPSARGRSAA